MSKLKVLHQILLVISIMIVFLVLEGILSLNTLTRMQSITQEVYNQTVKSQQIIYFVKYKNNTCFLFCTIL
jgi:hypothetical protein